MSKYNSISLDAAEQLLHAFVMYSGASLLSIVGNSTTAKIKEKEPNLSQKDTEHKVNRTTEKIIGVSLDSINQIDNNKEPQNLCWAIVINTLKYYKSERKSIITHLISEYTEALRKKDHPIYKHLSKQELKETFDILEHFLIEHT